MTTLAVQKLERRVVEAAEAALAEKKYVTSIDILVGIGWLTPRHVGEWYQGRSPCLERAAQANLNKISKAMKFFRRWAEQRGLKPSETAYVARTRDRRQLRFSKSGDPSIERAYRTHWVSPDLSKKRREQLLARESRPPGLVVVSPVNEWSCSECDGTGDFLIMEEPGPVCLGCADMGHLIFLPSGDAALTRRAKKASCLSAVVVRFSRSRKRYERQGILVEETAIFPGCPGRRAEAIAHHAGARSSGRVGRTAAARALDPKVIELAVTASVRHSDTPYDELLMSGLGREQARTQVRSEVETILDSWRNP